MANDGETNYTLAASEFAAVQSLLLFQEQFGLGAPAATLDKYGSGLDSLLGAYGQVQNTIIKSWLDAIFAYANDTKTLDPDTNVPVLHMLWHYGAFCNRDVVCEWSYATKPPSANWSSFWEAFVNGREVLYDAVGGDLWGGGDVPRITDAFYQVGPFQVPTSPASWNTSVTTKMKAWGLNPPAQYVNNFVQMWMKECCIVLINNDCHMYAENAAHGTPVHYYQMQILNSWTNVGTVAGQTAQAAVTAEHSCVAGLLDPSSLKPDAYFFMIHALIALAVTTVDNQVLAQTVVKTTTSSPEYPNDSFINQLIYLSLMYLADPLGNYTMTNKQLQVLLANLSALITATDAASTAIKQSLDNHIKILVADSAYPMQDPYSPSTGFNTRVADTLAALDAARQSIKVRLAATA
jgi:hypothetical protein